MIEPGTARASILPVRIARAIDQAVVAIATVATVGGIGVLFLTLMTEVVLRYFTTRGLGWPNEMPALLFPWVAMGGAVLAAQRGRHIAVTILYEHLPRPVTRTILVLLHLIVAVGFLYLAIVGIQVLAIAGGQRFPVSGISSYWSYLGLVGGFALIAATALTSLPRILIAEDPITARDDGTEPI